MYDFLKSVREHELGLALSNFPKNGKVLEIGAGAGWQAKIIASSGYEVEAIDIQDSRYEDVREWPVTIYDGGKIPFPDNYFDIVYSSNVLEHIKNLVAFQSEMQRVLKDGGIAVHILPSAYWRLWTTLTHYPYIFVTTIKYVLDNILLSKSKQSANNEKIKKMSKFKLLKMILFPGRHGERGNVFSETIYFSQSCWKQLFKDSGWKTKFIKPCQLMYSGNSLFGTILSLKKRLFMSRIFGSSSYIYVLNPGKK